MKNPILKAWQLVLLVTGVAFVGVGLKVTGETTSPTSESEISADANSVGPVVSANALVAGGTATNELFRPSTNNSVPPDLKVSSDLAEIIKLAQAGLSEEVMMAYITNFVRVFNLGSDEIIYLNDLGVPSSVVTAMIQQDTSPESAARKLAGNEPSPLPPGLALNSPASNVYPAQQSPAPQPEETTVESVTEAPPATTYAETDYAPQPAAVSYFYTSLAPYGNWVNVSGYGLCWQPTVVCADPSWRPYCDRGRWVYSDCGWYWLSDYSWGWAPFHYGRWVSHANYGWVWSPDRTWSPAWVSWRYSNDYCGWAPLPPEACFTSGVGFTFHNRSVGFGFEFGLGAHHYNFIPFDRFCDYSPSRYRVSPVYVQNVYNQTKFVNKIRVKGNNNTVINEGIDPAHVAAATRTEIRKVAIRDAQPGAGKVAKHDRLEKEGNKLVVFRPQLPPPSSPRPTASGGRTRSENRDRVAAADRTPATRVVSTSRTESSGVSSSDSTRISRGNTANIRASQRQNLTYSTSSPETEKSKVSVNRSSGGLTIRGEPRRHIEPITTTPTDVSGKKNEKTADVKTDATSQTASSLTFGSEPRRPQYQPQTGSRQIQAIAPAQPIARPAAEPARVERQQPRSYRKESPAPQPAPVRPQFNAPVQTPSQPVYTPPPPRPQFNPAPPAYSQPNRVERSNEPRSQPQFAQSERAARAAPPSYSPQPAPQSFAPAREHSQRQEPQRGNSQPSSQNSDRGDRKR